MSEEDIILGLGDEAAETALMLERGDQDRFIDERRA